MKNLSLRVVLPLLAVPGAFLLVPGCGGSGSTGPGTATATPVGTPTLTPVGTPTATPIGSSAQIAQGQAAFAQAVTSYQASGNSASVRASVQSAVTAFGSAVNAAPNSPDANAGLAASLLAQAATDINSPLVTATGANLLSGSKVMGLDNIVSLQSAKALSDAPMAVLSRALPATSTRSPRALINGVAVGVIQNYITAVELPRLTRVAAALSKVSTSPAYSFAVYKQGTQVKKLYGPDFGAAAAFAQTGIAALATLNGYNLDPGTLFDGVTNLSQLDVNHDGKLSPLEYVGNSAFLKLRPDGAANLTTALAALRQTANLAGGVINAEATFSAPADALVQLNAVQKHSLTTALPYVTQVKAALSGVASYPVNGQILTVDLSKFYTAPLPDLRVGLPTLAYSANAVTGFSFTSGQNTTLNGLFPNGTGAALALALN